MVSGMGERRAGDAAEGDDRAKGEIHPGREQDERHAHSEDTVDGDLPGDVGQVRDAQKGIGHEGKPQPDSQDDEEEAEAVE